DVDLGEVAAACPRTSIVRSPLPGLTGVVRTIDAAALRRIDSRVDRLWITRRNREGHAAETLRRRGQAIRYLAPVVAAVNCLVETAARTFPGAVFPSALASRPQVGVS